MHNLKPHWIIEISPQLAERAKIDLEPLHGKLECIDKSGRFFKTGSRLHCKAKDSQNESTQPTTPQDVFPFVRRQWRVDHMWPGSLTQDDFCTRAAWGLQRKFAEHEQSETGAFFSHVVVNCTFDDRAGLAQRLKDQIQKTQTAPVIQRGFQNTTPRQDCSEMPHELGLYVLLTPKMLVASLLSYATHGQISGLPIELKLTHSGRRAPSSALTAALTPPSAALTSGFSRAGHKIEDALAHALRMGWIKSNNNISAVYQKGKDDPSHSSGFLSGNWWLDLGASPGGISYRLAKLGCKVTAVDRAPLDPELSKLNGLRFIQDDVKHVSFDHDIFDGLVCDMNGPAQISAKLVTAQLHALRPGALIVFTAKLRDLSKWKIQTEEVIQLFQMRHAMFLGASHLFHNRNELTLFFRK